MPAAADSHKFVYYHLIRGYINHARREIARVGISVQFVSKARRKSSASTMRKKTGIKSIKSCWILCKLVKHIVFNIKNLTCTRENSLIPNYSSAIKLVCQISAILQDHVTVSWFFRRCEDKYTSAKSWDHVKSLSIKIQLNDCDDLLWMSESHMYICCGEEKWHFPRSTLSPINSNHPKMYICYNYTSYFCISWYFEFVNFVMFKNRWCNWNDGRLNISREFWNSMHKKLILTLNQIDKCINFLLGYRKKIPPWSLYLASTNQNPRIHWVASRAWWYI